MVFLGYMGIVDPIRPESPQVVSDLQKSGINVRMITGDSIQTAISIAKQCNIISSYEKNPNKYVLTGEQFAD